MSNLDNVLVDYKKHVEEMVALRKQVSEKIKNSMNGMFKEFFKNNPEFVYVTWTQYTPYFNDGEACEFSVHDKWFVTKKSLARYHDIDENSEDFEDMEFITGWAAEEAAVYMSSYSDTGKDTFIEDYGPERGPVVYEEARRLEKILDQIPEEIYLDAFGDHSQITISANGISVDEADHD